MFAEGTKHNRDVKPAVDRDPEIAARLLKRSEKKLFKKIIEIIFLIDRRGR